MANNKMINARVQQKIDTAENWAKAENFIPYKGEIIFYLIEGSDLPRWKIGNGVDKVDNLPFADQKLTAIDDGYGNITLMFGGEING